MIYEYIHPHMRCNKGVRLTQGAKQVDNDELKERTGYLIPRAFQKPTTYSPSSSRGLSTVLPTPSHSQVPTRPS